MWRRRPLSPGALYGNRRAPRGPGPNWCADVAASVLLCNAGGVISNWAQQDWESFTAAMAGGDTVMEKAALQRFLLGIAYRRETLHAHELARLIGMTDLSGEGRASLVDDVEFALGLLSAYDRLLGDGEEEDDDPDEFQGNGREPGIGDLVI